MKHDTAQRNVSLARIRSSIVCFYFFRNVEKRKSESCVRVSGKSVVSGVRRYQTKVNPI